MPQRCCAPRAQHAWGNDACGAVYSFPPIPRSPLVYRGGIFGGGKLSGREPDHPGPGRTRLEHSWGSNSCGEGSREPYHAGA